MTAAKLREFPHGIPFNAQVGIRLVRLHKDGVTIECPLRPELFNGAGVLHGGVTATLADVAVGIALAAHLGRSRAATTVEMKINHLRPVTHGKMAARSHLLKVGSRLCCGRGEITGVDCVPDSGCITRHA